MHHVIAKNFRLEGRAREFCTFTVETMAPGLLAEYQFVAYILRLLLWKSESNETSGAVSSTSDVTSTHVRRLKQIKRRGRGLPSLSACPRLSIPQSVPWSRSQTS